jgi:hypothetical protein
MPYVDAQVQNVPLATSIHIIQLSSSGRSGIEASCADLRVLVARPAWAWNAIFCGKTWPLILELSFCALPAQTKTIARRRLCNKTEKIALIIIAVRFSW